MKEAKSFFKNQQLKLIGGLYTALIGEIESYDPIENKADIHLLNTDELIVEIPVGSIQSGDFFIRIPYAPGDLVLVVFSQRDIDAIINGDDAPPTDRMLDKNDAIAVVGLNMFSDPLPATDTDKLVIGQKDGAATITIGNGEINLNGIVKVNGAAI